MLAATPEVPALAAPAQPTEVFRLAAAWQTHQCPHFDGVSCSLAPRIVQILPAVVANLYGELRCIGNYATGGPFPPASSHERMRV
jgi:hypothetical protein